MLAKGLPLDELRRKTLEEVHLKIEREALTRRNTRSSLLLEEGQEEGGANMRQARTRVSARES